MVVVNNSININCMFKFENIHSLNNDVHFTKWWFIAFILSSFTLSRGSSVRTVVRFCSNIRSSIKQFIQWTTKRYIGDDEKVKRSKYNPNLLKDLMNVSKGKTLARRIVLWLIFRSYSSFIVWRWRLEERNFGWNLVFDACWWIL